MTSWTLEAILIHFDRFLLSPFCRGRFLFFFLKMVTSGFKHDCEAVHSCLVAQRIRIPYSLCFIFLSRTLTLYIITKHLQDFSFKLHIVVLLPGNTESITTLE